MSIRTYTQPMQPLLFTKKKINLYRDTNNILFRHWRLLLAAPLFALLIGAVIGNVSPKVPLNWLMAAASLFLFSAAFLYLIHFIRQYRAKPKYE